MSYWSYRSYRGVQDCQNEKPQITKNTETTEKTEEHRDGRRAAAGRTASVFWESQRTRRTQSKRRRGGPCVRVKRTSGPGPGGAWRASHAMLWGRALTRPRPSTACSGDAGDTGAPLWGDGRGRCAKRRQPQRPSLQASKLPNFRGTTAPLMARLEGRGGLRTPRFGEGR